MAELDAIRVSPVFPANTQLDAGTRFVPLRHRHFDELPYASLIDGSERILFDDLKFLVRPEEGTGIITAHAEAGLCQVIRAKTKELGSLARFRRQ